MNALLKWLDGKKTYICSLICAASVFAHAQGWIDKQVLEILISAFGLGTIAALRRGMNKK